MPDQRVTYRRRHSYRTKRNKILLKKTPGGKNAVHYQSKKRSAPKCGDCKKALIGLPRLAPLKFMSISKRQKTVRFPLTSPKFPLSMGLPVPWPLKDCAAHCAGSREVAG